jgi:N4-gp56 family major capsid protein
VATTLASQAGFGALVQELVQARALEELRARAVHAMPGLYVPGRFVKGTNVIRYARYADLDASTPVVLNEGSAPVDQALTISSEFFTAAQYGQTVAVTDIAQLDNPHDLISIAAERVAYQATRTMDNLVRNNIHSTARTAAIQGATASQTIGVNAATAVSAPINGWLVKRMVADLLAANVQPFADGFFRLIIHPNQSFDLLTDTSTNGFIELNKYVSDLPALTNEVGRFGGCRIIVSSDAFRAAASAPTTYAAAGAVYNALFLSPDAYTIGDSQTLQSYFVAPGGDHNDPLAQKALVGYKMRFGSKLLHVSTDSTTSGDNGSPAGLGLARYRILRTTSSIS